MALSTEPLEELQGRTAQVGQQVWPPVKHGSGSVMLWEAGRSKNLQQNRTRLTTLYPSRGRTRTFSRLLWACRPTRWAVSWAVPVWLPNRTSRAGAAMMSDPKPGESEPMGTMLLICPETGTTKSSFSFWTVSQQSANINEFILINTAKLVQQNQNRCELTHGDKNKPAC